MPNNGIKLIVSEYNILWEALSHYEKHLEQKSAAADNEDEELVFDEKLQDIEGIKNSIALAAKNDYSLDLS